MTGSAPSSFVHRLEPATRPGLPPLLLLHGTGGDEMDLIPLGRMIAPGAALLSPRGKVLEGGAPRFFRRLAEGVFDEDDLRRRANELADFVGEARDAYGLDKPVALGFSNGANIAATLLLLRPEVLAGAALIRAMEPFRDPPAATIPETPVLILSGSVDPILPVENARRLAATLEAAGAKVEHEILPGGHALMQADVTRTASWIARLSGL